MRKDLLPGVEAPIAIMGVGIPGSGKSTILSRLSEETGVTRICPDDIRAEMTGSEMNQTVNREAWTEASRRAEELLGLGKSVIIDATHAEAWRRPEQIAMYRGYGAKSVVALYFQIVLEIAKERNVARGREGGRRVPDHAIERMYRAIKKAPPSIDEGFDQVIVLDQK